MINPVLYYELMSYDIVSGCRIIIADYIDYILAKVSIYRSMSKQYSGTCITTYVRNAYYAPCVLSAPLVQKLTYNN